VMSHPEFKEFRVVERANKSLYVLAAGGFGRRHHEGMRLRRRPCGTVWVNCYDVLMPAAHLAVQESGLGGLGEYGLANYGG